MSVDTPLIERILLAAGLPDPEISARVTGMGPDAVAGALLAEVCDRAALLAHRVLNGLPFSRRSNASAIVASKPPGNPSTVPSHQHGTV